jgi:hypothetical protein
MLRAGRRLAPTGPGECCLPASQRKDPPTVRDRLLGFLSDDDAEDLVEYALLGLFVGVVGVIVWNNIVTLIGTRYGEYNSNVQDLWVPPDP